MADGLSGFLRKIADDLAKLKSSNDDVRRQLFNALRLAEQEAAQKNIELDPAATAAQIAEALGNLDAGDALAEATGVNDLLGGGIIGRGHYESFDPNWIQCLVNYYQTRSQLRPFPSHKQKGIDPVRPLEGNPIKIAIAGDWGTGTTPPSDRPEDQAPFDSARAVAKQMHALAPDYTIHLGDVYYSGLGREEHDNFLQDWPRGNRGSYALNSNHEMYAGGAGYFDVLLLKDPDFQRSQQGLSYFALTNQNWLIIGLDTAFLACHQSARYNEGYLSDPAMENGTDQIEWLQGILGTHAGKRVILLTHHDGFSVNTVRAELTMRPLYNEVTQIMRDVRDWWWYWGHVHNVVVYERIRRGNNSSVTPRCIGHGAIPYLPSRPNPKGMGNGDFRVEWAESDLAQRTGSRRRAPNGFALITLNGADLHEQYYDEFGRSRWSNY